MTKYFIENVVGSGSYGSVVSGVEKASGKRVAIKYLSKIDDKKETAKKVLREIFLLHSLCHENILTLYYLHIANRDLYIVTDFFDLDMWRVNYPKPHESNLHSVLNTSSDYTYVMCQILKAIEYIHSVGVLHRDIKPSNILLNRNLKVKLCDFGFARFIENSNMISDQDSGEPLTEYMVTRWYRAPELFLNPGHYGKANDIWSAACTIAELIIHKPLFPGKNTIDQVQIIVETLDTLTAEDMNFDMLRRAKVFLRNLSKDTVGIGLKTVFSDSIIIHSEMICLLTQMLQFNPNHRVTASQALQSPLFNMFMNNSTATNTPSSSDISWSRYAQRLAELLNSKSKEERLSILKEEVKDIVGEIHMKKKSFEHSNQRYKMCNNTDKVKNTFSWMVPKVKSWISSLKRDRSRVVISTETPPIRLSPSTVTPATTRDKSVSLSLTSKIAVAMKSVCRVVVIGRERCHETNEKSSHERQGLPSTKSFSKSLRRRTHFVSRGVTPVAVRTSNEKPLKSEIGNITVPSDPNHPILRTTEIDGFLISDSAKTTGKTASTISLCSLDGACTEPVDTWHATDPVTELDSSGMVTNGVSRDVTSHRLEKIPSDHLIEMMDPTNFPIEHKALPVHSALINIHNPYRNKTIT